MVYSKKLKGVVSRVEAQAGHNFQSFVLDGNKQTFQSNPITGVREPFIDPNNPNNRYYGKMTLESYFGRLNVDILNKYLFTATLRGDASSLFPQDRRWGYFPAGAFAWKVKEESFLKNSSFVKDLKLRMGYGLTGNSDIRDVAFAGYYPYIPNVVPGSPQGQYLPGVNIYSVVPFNPNLTWEKTATANIGLDFEFFKSGLFSGAVDVYQKKTKDLLAFVGFPPGQFLTNGFVNNAAQITQRGVELGLTTKLITSDNMNWSLNGNIAYYKGKVDNVVGSSQIAAGNLPGIGRTLIYHAIGEEPGSAWVFEQVYDTTGNPIPDAYVDRNDDGTITDADKYYVAMTPNWTFGFGTTFNYKKLDFNASFRGQFGGKVYNSVKYQYGWSSKALPNVSNNLNNILDSDFLFDNVNGNIATSDYFLENATFLRCESISLGYKFDKLYKSTAMRLYVGVNNLFIITKYSGQDPENFGGIDTNFYPRPRVFNMGVNIDF